MSQPEDTKAALRAFRQAIRYTQSEIAEAIGIPVGRWKNYEYGKADPPKSVVRELRKIGYGSSTRPSPALGQPSIPVGFAVAQLRFAGTVPAGDWGDPLASEEFVEVEVKFEHHLRFAARVAGDSCYPALEQGDLTVWHSDLAPPYGSIVIAQRSRDEACTVKELRYEDGRPVLAPINPAHEAADDPDGWHVVGRLVGVIRKVDGTERTWYSPDGLKPRHLV